MSRFDTFSGETPTATSTTEEIARFVVEAAVHAQRVCRAPDPDHAALLAWHGDNVVGVASYEVTGHGDKAEVAFAGSDSMHHYGIATLLLDHLVSIARQHQIRAFTAETLAENTAMLKVFAAAGLPVHRELLDGVVDLTIPLPAGESDASLATYLDAVARRESYRSSGSFADLQQISK